MPKSIFFIFGFIFFSFSWLSPDHYRPWLSFHSELLAFLGFFGFFLSILIRSAGYLIVPRLSYFIFLVIFFPWIQFIFGLSFYSGDVLLSGFFLFSFSAAIFLGYCFFGLRNSVKCYLIGLMHSLWFAALFSAVIGLIQWLNLQDFFSENILQADIGDRAKGNLGQPNQLATLLLMGIAALVYIFEQKVIGKTGLAMAAFFMTAVLVLTQSRAGMISVFVITAFLLWKQRSGNLRLSKQAILWWFSGFTLATLSLPSLSEWLLISGSRGLTETGSISERWLIWKQVAYAIGQAPWLGYGWNQTPTANAVGALPFPGSTTYTNAHNIVLDLMAWCGIPVGLLLTSLMAYWVFSRLRSVQQPGAILAMAALLPIGVHSLLEFPFAYAYFLIAAGFFIGIVEAAHVSSRSVLIKAHWLWAVLSIWAGIGGYMAYEYFQIEEDFRVVRFENLRVGATPAGYEVPDIWMLSHMAAMLKAARQVPKPDMPMADLENLRKVSDRFAYGAIRFKYVQALGLNGDPTGAARQMQIIHGMYGDFFYKACKDEFARLTAEKYPQLALVKIPD